MPLPVMNGALVRMDAEDASAAGVAREVCRGVWASRAEVLKETARTTVYAGQAEGVARGVVVKCMALRGAGDRLAVLMGRTRLMRQWNGAAMLRSAGIAAARPIALVRGKSPGGAVVETLVMERAGGVEAVIEAGVEPPATLLHAIAQGTLGARAEHEIARRVGLDLRAMFDAGLTDRDHKPSNLVPERRVGGEWRVVAVDTVGVRRRGGRSARLRTLASLVIEPMGVGHPVRRGLIMRALLALHGEAAGARARVRRDWAAVARVVRAHGDATPKDDPLG